MKISKLFSIIFSTPLLIAPVAACAPTTTINQKANINAVTLASALSGFTTTFTQASNPTAKQVMSAISK
jgi:hypothetical protein